MLFIRELLEDDINQRYLDGFKDEDVLAFLEVNGKDLTKEDVVSYMNLGKESGSYHMHAICLEENGLHIGNIKVGPIDKKHKTADLVTVIWDSDFWGKGLATKAIKLGNKLAFEHYNLRKLSGGMYESNVGSIKAYTKAGWIIEGRLQNHFRVAKGKYEDKVLVSCFNPSFIEDEK